jgi:hypothetical protein
MTSNYSGTFTTKAKTYETGMRSLVKHIFKNDDKNTYRVSNIDDDSDPYRRVFVDVEFNLNYNDPDKYPDWCCEGDVSIRLWNIEDVGKRKRIQYTTYWTHDCNKCGKEETMEYGMELCDECVSK